MKDQIDVSVRRSPKFAAFMAVGAIAGVLLAGLLTLVIDPSEVPAEYTVAKGAGLLLVVLGVGGLFVGGLVALILDWRGRKRAREYRVEAQIDLVDDPKVIAQRRIAEMRGEEIPAETAAETPAEPSSATSTEPPADDRRTTGDQGGSTRPTTGS
jgi:hypothetical protein